jgi:dTDP-4-amino-4,6-dideoxygalactose transaminase
VHHLYVIRSSHRDALQAHLKKQNIHSLIHYPVPIHLQKSCKGIKRDPFGLFNAEAHANTALSLPCYPTMSKNQMEKVVDAVNTFVI